MRPDATIWNLITAKLAHELTPSQERELAIWLEDSPANQQTFDHIKQLWESGNSMEIPESKTAANWDQLEFRLNEENDRQASSYPGTQNLTRRRNTRWLAVAVTLTLAVAAGAYYLNKSPQTTPLRAGNVMDSVQVVSVVTKKIWTHQVTADSVRYLRLPDGTKVWLNNKTTLSFDKNYNQQNREVSLSGEAYFEVQRDEDRPFIIHASDSKTRVLGTAFNLMAYEDTSSEITVVSGTVGFSHRTPTDSLLILKAGEKGILDADARIITRKSNDNPHFLDWKHALVYREEISRPAEYLSDNFQKKKSAINQTEIDGTIYNHASLATYKNIKLRVQYYHKKKEKMKTHVFTVYQSVGPGETIDYRYRLADWFSQTDQLQIRVEDATVTKN